MRDRVETTCPECGGLALLDEDDDGLTWFVCLDEEECGHRWPARGRSLALRHLAQDGQRRHGRRYRGGGGRKPPSHAGRDSSRYFAKRP